jgi:Domain of unknown function (DUF4430)
MLGETKMMRRELLLAVLAMLFCSTAIAQEPAAPKVVQLTIDYGDGSQKVFTELAWKEKHTVFDVLQAAEKHARGIKLKHRGSGAALFVTAIDDVANEGVGSNWLYEVNGTPGDRSCAIFDVQAGDKVLWKFGKKR